MEIYDISQTLCREIAVWPGDPEFRYRWTMKIREGASSNVSAVEMCVHTGTHVDAPLHRNDSGSEITGVPLHHFIGSVRVFSIPAEKCIRLASVSSLDWQNVERVLFKTRSSKQPEYSFDQDFVYLDEAASEFLTQKGILLVGTDAPSVDAFNSANLPCHRMLLGHGIAILEGARLENVPPGDYELICFPLKLAGLDGSPVRAVLRK
jgi:arylformamidase